MRAIEAHNLYSLCQQGVDQPGFSDASAGMVAVKQVLRSKLT